MYKRKITFIDVDLLGEISGINCNSSSYNMLKIKNFLLSNNYQIVDDWTLSEDVIINTCRVYQEYERNYLEKIRQIKASGKRVGIIGCFSQGSPNISSAADFVIENKKEFLIEDFYPHTIRYNQILDTEVSKSFPSENQKDKNTYFLSVNRGCIHNCSYCGIKKAIGFTKSKPLIEIRGEVRYAIENGYKNLHLVTDDICSYGYDIQTNFPQLLDTIFSFGKEFNIYIDYGEPSEWIKWFPYIKDKIKYIKEIHLPVQSVNDRILKLMRRKYTYAQFVEIIERTKAMNSSITLGNSVIYCYPTESYDEFKNNFKVLPLMTQSLFAPFSYIPGTKVFPPEDFLSAQEIQRRVAIVEKIRRAETMKWEQTPTEFRIKYNYLLPRMGQ